MNYQEVIERQLQIVEEGREILTVEEFSLICEAEYYRPPGEKWYSKHRSLVSIGSKIGAGAATIATLGAYGKYRKMTDKCRQTCKGIKGMRQQRCMAVCNMNAAKRVIQLIKSNKGRLGKITDPEKRKKAKDIIDKEGAKWDERYDKYRARVSSLSAMVTQTSMKRN